MTGRIKIQTVLQTAYSTGAKRFPDS